MSIYKPSELRAFLDSIGQGPKKGLSQNFLIDGNIIRNIVKAAEVLPGDQILEIGPGPGALTEELLNRGAKVLALEIDPVLAGSLLRLQTSDHRLQVMEKDALHVPLDSILTSKTKLISNLPYHITTPLLTRFIPQHEQISSIFVMVQDEVAKRMTAKSGTSEYGSITVFLNFYADLKYLFKVSRQCFYPIPSVDSAIVRLDLKKPPSGIDEDVFFKLTRTAFKQRRKMMRSSLKELYPPDLVMRSLESLKLSALARPEELSLDNFLQLYRLLVSM